MTTMTRNQKEVWRTKFEEAWARKRAEKAMKEENGQMHLPLPKAEEDMKSEEELLEKSPRFVRGHTGNVLWFKAVSKATHDGNKKASYGTAVAIYNAYKKKMRTDEDFAYEVQEEISELDWMLAAASGAPTL